VRAIARTQIVHPLAAGHLEDRCGLAETGTSGRHRRLPPHRRAVPQAAAHPVAPRLHRHPVAPC